MVVNVEILSSILRYLFSRINLYLKNFHNKIGSSCRKDGIFYKRLCLIFNCVVLYWFPVWEVFLTFGTNLDMFQGKDLFMNCQRSFLYQRQFRSNSKPNSLEGSTTYVFLVVSLVARSVADSSFTLNKLLPALS